MWLRSEKRSSRISQPNNKSMNIRKIVKHTPALKNLKQTTSTVTKSTKIFRKTADIKQSPSIKCNIKSQTNVKRLNKKSKRLEKKRITRVAEKSSSKQKCTQLRRKSLRALSEIGKENCWQNQEQSFDNKHGKKSKSGNSHKSNNSIESTSAVGDSLRADTFKNFPLVNELCDSCKPSTTCCCSLSSSQTDESQSTSDVSTMKNNCVNYIECDSTTDNDRISLPSTSMLTLVSVFYIFIQTNRQS